MGPGASKVKTSLENDGSKRVEIDISIDILSEGKLKKKRSSPLQTGLKRNLANEDFTDKERIRMEEEGLSEKDFQKIPVSDEDCADFESITPHNESCWAEKDLVKLEDLDFANLSPRSEEEILETHNKKSKAKRPMKRKRKKAE